MLRSVSATARPCLRATPLPRSVMVRSMSSSTAASHTTTSLRVSELPKLVKPEPLHANEEELVPRWDTFGSKKVQLPPLLKSIREVMDRHKGYVVLTQVGAFYEMYFEQASEYAEKLNITLTQKSMTDFAVPMSGFPLSQLERHLRVLVQDLHECVAIVEQIEAGESGEKSKVMPRRVTRIVTAGTLVEEAFLNQQESNFLLCINFPEKLFKREADLDAKVGLSWMDLSVGSLFVQEVRLEDLMSTVTRIKPSEIIVGDEEFAEIVDNGVWYSELTGFQKYFINHFTPPTRHKTLEEFYYMFHFTRNDLKKAFGELSIWESSALRVILRYVEELLPSTTISLQLPEKQHPENIVFLDSRTTEALELHVSMRNRKTVGSLFSSIKRTVTAGGSRLLGMWLSAPSRDLEELKIRQRMVGEFVQNTTFRNSVISKLKRIHDVSRILQRFALGKGSHFDLIRLAHSINVTDELEAIIQEQSRMSADAKRALMPLLKRFKPHGALAAEILGDLDEKAVMEGLKLEEEEKEAEIYPTILEKRAKTGSANSLTSLPNFIVKKQASSKLSRLHNKLTNLFSEKSTLEKKLHELLVLNGSFKEVQLKVTTSADYQLFVRGGARSDYDDLLTLVPGTRDVTGGKSKSTRWLEFDQWTNIGHSIQSVTVMIQREEQEVLKKLRKKVNSSSVSLRQSSQNIEYIDVITSFASLSVEKDLVCPDLDSSTSLDIVQGRHLVAEEGLRRELKNFVANDCSLSGENKRWLITGPNMGGKSTFLRQNAIIVILAQIGCFVPAQSAEIGLVDKIFSRVGFNDDMMNQLSTFMVEMLEVSYILHGATERSLAILDEVGRGTSGREGVAIAFSTLCHLDQVNNCRVLFATHFGKEVATLLGREGLHNRFSYKKIALVGDGDSVNMTHKLVDGITDRSYAINVARAAGYPPLAIDKAREAYEFLSQREIL